MIVADQRGTDIADYHHRRAEAALAVLDSHLAQGKYLCAAEPTIADLFRYGDVAFAEVCAFDLNRWPQSRKMGPASDAVARLQGTIRTAGNGGCGIVLDCPRSTSLVPHRCW
jgi:glutathione S-transferase